MYAKLLCQVRQRNLTKLLRSLPWLHLQCCVRQKSQCHMTRFPWCIDEAHNNNKGVQAYTKHPKVKWTCIIIRDAKIGMIQFSLVFSIILRNTSITIWRYEGNCTHPHYHKTKHYSHKFSIENKGDNPL
jgi:hypothetical protein